MSKSIKISYLWDKAFAIESSYNLYEYELKKSNKKYIGWFFVILSQFGVVGALKHNAYGFLVVASFGILYWYGLRWQLRKYFIIRSFDKSTLANTMILLEATTDGLYNNSKIQLLYKDILNIEQLENAIIIYHNLGTIYIPYKAFNNTKDRKLFLSYITKIIL